MVARHNVDLIKSGLLPRVGLNAQYTYKSKPFERVERTDQATVLGHARSRSMSAADIDGIGSKVMGPAFNSDR